MRKTSKWVKGLGLPGSPRLAAIESASLIPKRCLKCPAAGTAAGSARTTAPLSLFSPKKMFFTPLWGSFRGLWIRTSSGLRSYACLSAAPRNCGNVSEDISLKLKEEASEDGRVLGGSKGPSSHLGPDKRTWQISKWSPMYYISVRTPSAFPPTLHFHLWHGHIDLKERRGAGREGRWVSAGVIMCPIQFSRWGD